MEITGRLVQTLSVVTGTSARGDWKKQDFIIETKDEYPKKVCITAWGDKVDEVNALDIGTTITCHINLESREYNSRWYTDVKIWKLERVEGDGEEEIPQGNEVDYSNAEPDTLPF